jgi:DNA-binding response OmpR family regulator
MAVVLVVEDDPANAQMVAAMLTRAGHRVLTAADGPGGLESARSWDPDTILLGVSLAGSMNGLEVCRALPAEPGTAKTPIIMLSGWAFETDVEAGRAAGCDDYLAKPFGQDELLARVQRVLDGAATQPRPQP